jgi:hypothetical protein
MDPTTMNSKESLFITTQMMDIATSKILPTSQYDMIGREKPISKYGTNMSDKREQKMDKILTWIDKIPDENPSSEYKEKISTIGERVPWLLNELEKYYVLSEKNPDVPEYKTQLQEATNEIALSEKESITIMNELKKKIFRLSEIMQKIQTIIDQEKYSSPEEDNIFRNFYQLNKGSSERVGDYQGTYTINRWKIITIWIGLICMMYLCVKKGIS